MSRCAPRTPSPDPNPPRVGDGATILRYSDQHACTIVYVSPSGKTIGLRRDKATLLNSVRSKEPDALQFTPGGFCGHTSGVQRYTYEADRTAPEVRATLRKDGKFRLSGGKARVVIGKRDEHYDYNF